MVMEGSLIWVELNGMGVELNSTVSRDLYEVGSVDVVNGLSGRLDNMDGNFCLMNIHENSRKKLSESFGHKLKWTYCDEITNSCSMTIE